jgi:hypothetical protein
LGYERNDNRWLNIYQKVEKENTAFIRITSQYVFIRIKNNRDGRGGSHITIAINFNKGSNLALSPDAINSLFHKILELGKLEDFQKGIKVKKVINLDDPELDLKKI